MNSSVFMLRMAILNQNNVGHAVETKSPVRASTTSSSSSDLFIPRSANKRIHDLKDKQQCESSTTSNVAEVQSEPNSLRLNSFRSSLSSENVTIRDLSYRPSLTLVYETPSEDTVDESVHYPKNICNNEANGIVYQTDTEENSVSNDAAKKTVLEAPDKTLTPSKLFSGEQWVYGKWKSEKNYYAGKVYPSENCLRSLVIFEDGTRARIKPSDMITVYLLPVGTEVSAELKDDNEYWGDCIIEAHLSDPERPYKVICRTSNEIYCLRRGQVSVHESEVDNLKRLDNEIVSDTNSVTKICASPDVSLSNLVFDKRKSKPKIYRSSWVTPVKHLAPMEKNDDQQPKTLPSKLTASTQLRKRYRNQFKWNLPSSTRNGRFETNPVVQMKMQIQQKSNPMSLEMPITKLKDTNQKNNTNQMMFKKIQLSPLPKSRASIGLLRSLSHSLNIPIPSSSVFQGWTIILTGGVKNNTFEKSFDRNLIEQLVVACGGKIASEINPSLLNRRNGCESPELDEGFGRKMTHQTHFIAVVSTDCCRTLKYFQALATLGSVPLLRTEWLLDSCREDAKASGDESINEETRNWPLYLLRSYPGRYELPRGFISGSTEPISWWSVPVRYRSPAYQTIPAPSLFDLHGDWADSETTFRLVAIVTNDVSVFGPGWLNILSLACGSTKEVDESHQTSCNRILLIPLSEAFQRLSTLFPSIRSRCKSLEKKVNFVLVDKNNVTQSAIAFMKTLPVEMVTCDYFIHSLICGHLVDPKSSSYFSPLT
ncbi:unnamed protein product [Heterobilharzia americana]|nr:unnamed protein product [Heterobilharzia americana]